MLLVRNFVPGGVWNASLAESLASSNAVFVRVREIPLALVANDEKALTLLRHAVPHGVQQLPLDKVSEAGKRTPDMIEVRLVLVQHAPDVLNEGELGLIRSTAERKAGNPSRASFSAVLQAEHRERLAGWSADDHVRRLNEFLPGLKDELLALSQQVLVVCPAGILQHLEANRLEACRLESQCQSAAACEQVKHHFLASYVLRLGSCFLRSSKYSIIR